VLLPTRVISLECWCDFFLTLALLFILILILALANTPRAFLTLLQPIFAQPTSAHRPFCIQLCIEEAGPSLHFPYLHSLFSSQLHRSTVCTAPVLLCWRTVFPSFWCCSSVIVTESSPLLLPHLLLAEITEVIHHYVFDPPQLPHLSQETRLQRHLSPLDSCQLEGPSLSPSQATGCQSSRNRCWPPARTIQSMVPGT
jgi:hypothetical protein